MRDVPAPLYLLPFVLGLYVALVLRQGFVRIPGLPPIRRTLRPRAYWALVIAPPLVIVAVIALDFAFR